MMPENSVDAFAFWIVLGIFIVIAGNLVYESFIVQWIVKREQRCEAVCCIKGEENE